MQQELVLRELADGDETIFLAGVEDWRNDDLNLYTFVWEPGMRHDEHLQLLRDQKDKSKLEPDRVPSAMLYGFVNEKIVGRVNVRYELNRALMERGGHVGYAVNPGHRENGYATKMFEQSLKFCQTLGLIEILVTCEDQNVPSRKIVERFGGSLESRFFAEDIEKFVRRYWLSTQYDSFDKSKVSRKAVAYITRRGSSGTQLLVFDHDPQFQDAGTQVPSGTLEVGENPREAALREVREESGLDLEHLRFEGALDEYQFFSAVHRKYLHRHVYHFTADDDIANGWVHKVSGDGGDRGLNFHFRWIDLNSAKGQLSGRFGDSIDLLVQRLAHRSR